MVKTYRPRYAIRTVIPAGGYLGVWTHEVDGGFVLETYPLDFVGVADRQVFSRGKWEDDGTEIMAVVLRDGFFDVVAENESFHGIVPAAATREECLELVPSHRQKRLVNADEAPVLQPIE